ncbi:esterase/lipase family protein [Nanoarchaeota archaeon]
MGLRNIVEKQFRKLTGTPEKPSELLRGKAELLANELRYGIMNASGIVEEYVRDDPVEDPKLKILEGGIANQRPLILLHGWGENAGIWDDYTKQIKKLNMHNVTAVGYDFWDPPEESANGRVAWRIEQIIDQTRISRIWQDVTNLLDSPEYKSRTSEFKTELQECLDIRNYKGFYETLKLKVKETKKETKLKHKVERIIKSREKEKVDIDILGFSEGGLIAKYYSVHHSDIVDHCVMLGAPHDGTHVANLAYPFRLGDLVRKVLGIKKTDHVGKSGRRHYDISYSSARDMKPGSKFITQLNNDYDALVARNGKLKTKFINIFTSEDEAVLGSTYLKGAINFNVGLLKYIPDVEPTREGISHFKKLRIGHLGLIHNSWLIGWLPKLLSKAFNGHYKNLRKLNEMGIVFYIQDHLGRKKDDKRYLSYLRRDDCKAGYNIVDKLMPQEQPTLYQAPLQRTKRAA